MSSTLPRQQVRYEIHYPSLFDPGRGVAFPCDAQGRVDLDTLSPRARVSYFYARTVIGREFGAPAVLEVA